MSNYWNGRVSRRRFVGTSAGVALGAAFIAACGGDGGSDSSSTPVSSLVAKAQDTTKQATRGGTLKNRISAGASTLDTFTVQAPAAPMWALAYNKLVDFKPGYLKPSVNELGPAIMNSWETSPDGLTITMKLRDGAKWHNKAPVNGRVVDVDDMLFTWSRFIAKNPAARTIANSLDPSAPVLSFTASDTKTLVIKLKEPLSYTLGLFADLIGIPKETDTGFDSRNEIIGTGPFYLSDMTPSVSYTLKRNPEYWDKDYAMVDQMDMPIIQDYAAALAQFQAGNIHVMTSYNPTVGVTQEDVIAVKKAEPRISLYEGDLGDPGVVTRLGYGWQPEAQSPFRDERVRQAVSMAVNRDLFLDTFMNVAKFQAEGLNVETRWNTALTARFEGWWLDPKGKDFGENAKYFQHNPTEAKKLLAAAGHTNGFETTSNYVTGPQLGNGPKQAEVIDAMLAEIGIKAKVKPLDYATEYPRLLNGRGQFDGWFYKSSAGGAPGGSAVGFLATEYWSQSGTTFAGFGAGGRGDPALDAKFVKARTEQDPEKQRAMVFDLQRELAKAAYMLPLPGSATTFFEAWPCVGNFHVYTGSIRSSVTSVSAQGWWLDKTKAPFA